MGYANHESAKKLEGAHIILVVRRFEKLVSDK